MIDIVYYKNDTLLTAAGIKNTATNSFVNNAIVHVLGITTVDNEAVTGATFPIVLVYVNGSNGNYRCNLPNTLNLIPNTRYICKLQATTEDNLKGYWEITFTCRSRIE